MPSVSEPVIGEFYIRRQVNIPAGTPAQRIAWAAATEPSGYHVGIVNTSEVGFIRLNVGYGSTRYGLYRISRGTFAIEWERP